ncbi:hypothetical protein Pelo_17542 [Pelomyxa schiedti]|nr:hypothetical protein Pelo_17542 [Pelomyxa schiedti]
MSDENEKATREKTPSASSVSKEVRHPPGATPTTHKEGDRTVEVTTRDAANSSLMQQFNEAAEGDDDVAEDNELTEEVERVCDTRCVEEGYPMGTLTVSNN